VIPTGPDPAPYALERSETELRRLTLQDELLRGITRSLFERAGIAEGMRVLDIGSGPGGVALLAAGLVGPSGSVVGVEMDEESVETARGHATEARAGHVEFLVADVGTATLPGPFDAVIGRLVLLHVADPVAVLARLREQLRPGAIVAFLEGHMAAPWLSRPPSPTLGQIERVRQGAVGRVGPNLHMGLELWRTFLGAGLPEPHLTAEAPIGGGPGWIGFDYMERTVRSLSVMWRRAGVEGVDEIVLDGLAARIEQEVGEEGTVMLQPFVGAWVRIP
jgi:SAM-dependent methyltransferase